MNHSLKQLAIEAMKNSYSPYSNRTVGAAIRLTNGKVFTGCNIENSSFGGTVCAERVAVWNAVSALGGSIQICEVFVATDASRPGPPADYADRSSMSLWQKNVKSYWLIPRAKRFTIDTTTFFLTDSTGAP